MIGVQLAEPLFPYCDLSGTLLTPRHEEIIHDLLISWVQPRHDVAMMFLWAGEEQLPALNLLERAAAGHLHPKFQTLVYDDKFSLVLVFCCRPETYELCNHLRRESST